MPILQVADLVTRFHAPGRVVTAVDGVSFAVEAGQIFGIVGESGCGKSATCRSVLRLFGGADARVAAGRIVLDGQGDLAQFDERAMRRVRGRDVSMIFQDPMTALNPTMRIGRQIAEVFEAHGRLSRREARRRALDMLKAVHVTSPERRMAAYPHELSGGLRQRVVIAMALALSPRLVIADEPTTALDVTVQAQILALLRERTANAGAAVILVTHDLGVVAGTCDHVAVMYAGRIVETGPAEAVLRQPSHPYTRALLAALPARSRPGTALAPVEGTPPDLADPPPGCRFAPRCHRAIDACRQGPPPALRPRAGVPPNHLDACIREDADVRP